MRIFISIELPETIKDNIAGAVNKMRTMLTPVKWVEKKNLHITLKFLGWVEDEKVKGLEDCVAECVKGFGAFELEFSGMGAFPDLKRPRVIWVGTKDGAESSKELADKIDCEISEKGFREEEREYTPHLTVGRIKERIDVAPLMDFIAEHERTDFGKFKVDHVSVMKSTLRRTGPIYDEIGRISL